jgi:rubrerythrin
MEERMERFSISEVIEQAVQTEKLGRQFYDSMAVRFKDEKKLKDLFENLASKEIEHEETFRRLKGMAKDEAPENWEEVSMYLRAIVESEFFLGKNKALPSLGHVDSVTAAVHFAIGFEKESLCAQELRYLMIA